jgi:hypothetical protein
MFTTTIRKITLDLSLSCWSRDHYKDKLNYSDEYCTNDGTIEDYETFLKNKELA